MMFEHVFLIRGIPPFHTADGDPPYGRTRHCGEGLFAAGDVDQSGAGQDPATSVATMVTD